MCYIQCIWGFPVLPLALQFAHAAAFKHTISERNINTLMPMRVSTIASRVWWTPIAGCCWVWYVLSYMLYIQHPHINRNLHSFSRCTVDMNSFEKSQHPAPCALLVMNGPYSHYCCFQTNIFVLPIALFFESNVEWMKLSKSGEEKKVSTHCRNSNKNKLCTQITSPIFIIIVVVLHFQRPTFIQCEARLRKREE